MISAKEARNISKNSSKTVIIDYIISRILYAAKNGEYSVRIGSEYLDDIKDIFQDQGYKVNFINEKCIEISWYD